MTIDWIKVTSRVPTDRREILIWGTWSYSGYRSKPHFLGATKYNPGDCFDVEKKNRLLSTQVTHWAEITGPDNV